MTAQTLPDGSLLVTHGAPLHLAAVAGTLALAAWALLDPTPEPRQRLGGVIYLGFALLLAATHERSRFRFDPAAGRVTWSRRGIFRARSGEIPFAALEGLAVESRYADTSGHAKLHRLALVFAGGERLPLTNAYYPNYERFRALGEGIRQSVRPVRELAFNTQRSTSAR